MSNCDPGRVCQEVLLEWVKFSQQSSKKSSAESKDGEGGVRVLRGGKRESERLQNYNMIAQWQ